MTGWLIFTIDRRLCTFLPDGDDRWLNAPVHAATYRMRVEFAEFDEFAKRAEELARIA